MKRYTRPRLGAISPFYVTPTTTLIIQDCFQSYQIDTIIKSNNTRASTYAKHNIIDIIVDIHSMHDANTYQPKSYIDKDGILTIIVQD